MFKVGGGGTLRAVFIHKLGYVPDGSSDPENDYGSDVKFYKPFSTTEQAENYFHAFLKSKLNLQAIHSPPDLRGAPPQYKPAILLDIPEGKDRDELTIDDLRKFI